MILFFNKMERIEIDSDDSDDGIRPSVIMKTLEDKQKLLLSISSNSKDQNIKKIQETLDYVIDLLFKSSKKNSTICKVAWDAFKEYEQKFSSAQAENIRLKNEIDKTTTKLTTLQLLTSKEIQQFAVETDNQFEEFSSNILNLDNCKKNLKELFRHYASTLNELEQYKKSYEVTNNELQIRTNTSNELKNQLDVSKNQHATIFQNYEKIQKLYNETNSELDKLKEELIQKTEEINKFQQEITRFKSVEEFNAQIKSSEILQKNKETIEKQKNIIKKSSEFFDDLRNIIRDSNFLETTKEFLLFDKNIPILEKITKSKEELILLINQTNQSIEKHETNNNDFKKKINSLTTEIEKLKKEKNELELRDESSEYDIICEEKSKLETKIKRYTLALENSNNIIKKIYDSKDYDLLELYNDQKKLVDINSELDKLLFHNTKKLYANLQTFLNSKEFKSIEEKYKLLKNSTNIPQITNIINVFLKSSILSVDNKNEIKTFITNTSVILNDINEQNKRIRLPNYNENQNNDFDFLFERFQSLEEINLIFQQSLNILNNYTSLAKHVNSLITYEESSDYKKNEKPEISTITTNENLDNLPVLNNIENQQMFNVITKNMRDEENLQKTENLNKSPTKRKQNNDEYPNKQRKSSLDELLFNDLKNNTNQKTVNSESLNKLLDEINSSQSGENKENPNETIIIEDSEENKHESNLNNSKLLNESVLLNESNESEFLNESKVFNESELLNETKNSEVETQIEIDDPILEKNKLLVEKTNKFLQNKATKEQFEKNSKGNKSKGRHKQIANEKAKQITPIETITLSSSSSSSNLSKNISNINENAVSSEDIKIDSDTLMSSFDDSNLSELTNSNMHHGVG